MNWVVDVEALWQRVSPTEQEHAQAEYETYSTWVLRRPPSRIELRTDPGDVRPGGRTGGADSVYTKGPRPRPSSGASMTWRVVRMTSPA